MLQDNVAIWVEKLTLTLVCTSCSFEMTRHDNINGSLRLNLHGLHNTSNPERALVCYAPLILFKK